MATITLSVSLADIRTIPEHIDATFDRLLPDFLDLHNKNRMTTMTQLTPMLQQYLEIKGQHEDTILFYRMGDFYEMFFDDAIVASKILGITLTSRNKKSDTVQVPMCGIPYHAAQTYLAKLIKAGRRVAICEQTENPCGSKRNCQKRGCPHNFTGSYHRRPAP